MSSSPLPVRVHLTGKASVDRLVKQLTGDFSPLLNSPLAAAQLVQIANALPLVVAAGSYQIFSKPNNFNSAQNQSTPDIPLSATYGNLIPHGLGRPFTGRIIAYQSAVSTVIDGNPLLIAPVYTTSEYMLLICTIDCKVRVVVF